MLFGGGSEGCGFIRTVCAGGAVRVPLERRPSPRNSAPGQSSLKAVSCPGSRGGPGPRPGELPGQHAGRREMLPRALGGLSLQREAEPLFPARVTPPNGHKYLLSPGIISIWEPPSSTDHFRGPSCQVKFR